MKVYQMNDYEWVASNWDVRETLDWYLKEFGLSEEENPLEDVRECDIDREGMWYEYTDIEHIRELEAQGIKQTQKGRKPEFGDLKKIGKCWYIFLPFRKVLEQEGFTESSSPFVIATTE